MKTVQNQAKPVSKQTWRNKVTYVKKNWQLYLFFLMPGLLLTIIFKYLPMGGLLIAFEDYNVIKGVLGSPWVGLEYFRRFLSSPDFMNYLMNTLTGIKKKVQLLIYMPNFISVIVLCGMVRMLLSPVGPLNRLLGISTNWMTMPSAFRTIYIASGIWQTAGWASIMYTAALSNASKELEEAAVMDGANLLQQIWYVELPAIKNIIVIQFILQAGNIMSIGFEKAYALNKQKESLRECLMCCRCRHDEEAFAEIAKRYQVEERKQQEIRNEISIACKSEKLEQFESHLEELAQRTGGAQKVKARKEVMDVIVQWKKEYRRSCKV